MPLPWPHWSETPDGRITVSGRHRTSRTSKLASELSSALGVALMINCFCVHHSYINPWIVAVARAYNPQWTVGGVYICILLIGPFVALGLGAAATPLIRHAVKQNSTVRFAAGCVEVPRRFVPGWHKYDVDVGRLAFFATARQHTHAYEHTDRQGNVSSGISCVDLYTVIMRLSRGTVTLGEFIDEDKAVAFIAACEAAADACAARDSGGARAVVTVRRLEQTDGRGGNAFYGQTRPAFEPRDKGQFRRLR